MKHIIGVRAVALAGIGSLYAASLAQTIPAPAPGSPQANSQGTSAPQPPMPQPSAVQAPVLNPVISGNPVTPVNKPGAEDKKNNKNKTSLQSLGPHGAILPMTISYRAWQGLITLYGLANGNNPARFVVSTGLNMSTVSPEDAIRLQLTTSPARAHVALLDASTDVPTASILNLRLGGGILHNIPVAQVNLISLLTRESVPDAPTCWLGTDWLSEYQITLDTEAHVLILDARNAHLPKPSGTIVPFKLQNGRPVVKVTVPGIGSYQAIVDSGMMGTLVPSEIALRVKSKKLDKKTPKIGVDIGAGRMGRMVMPKIAIGKSELKDLLVAYYGVSAPASADRTMGIIGMDFLRRFRVTFNYSRNQMQLYAPEPVEADKPANNPSNGRRPSPGSGTSPFGTTPFGSSPAGTNSSGTSATGTILH